MGSLWLRGQAVKTSPFHGGNTGSIPVRVIPCLLKSTSYADVAQLAEQLICNQQVIGSSPIIGFYQFNIDMGGFPSGQRGQTVNLLQLASVVRIHLHPFSDLFQAADDAGWSSLEARRAHNPKVIGSNPVPATQ